MLALMLWPERRALVSQTKGKLRLDDNSVVRLLASNSWGGDGVR